MTIEGRRRRRTPVDKEKMAEVEAALPAGVTFVVGYDRCGLIERAIHTLREKLMGPFIRGVVKPESANPVNRLLITAFEGRRDRDFEP